MSRSSAGSLPGSPLARIRSMTSSRRPLRRAAPTWAAHTYAASRSRTALRMAIDRGLGSTTVVSRKNVTSESIRSASLGLWSSMLNGPRTPPNTVHHGIDHGLVLGRDVGLAGDGSDARHGELLSTSQRGVARVNDRR